MAGLAEVRGCMPAARVVAASELPAGEAHTQVHPRVARLQALLTAGNRLRELGDANRVDVRALSGHATARLPSVSGWARDGDPALRGSRVVDGDVRTRPLELPR